MIDSSRRVGHGYQRVALLPQTVSGTVVQREVPSSMNCAYAGAGLDVRMQDRNQNTC
jgi:hypothetical protein